MAKQLTRRLTISRVKKTEIFKSKKSVKGFTLVSLPPLFFIGCLVFLKFLSILGEETQVASILAIVFTCVAIIFCTVVYCGLNYKLGEHRIEVRILSDVVLTINYSDIQSVRMVQKNFNVIGFSSDCIEINCFKKKYYLSPKQVSYFTSQVKSKLTLQGLHNK